jgi:hypothetical protein
MKGLFNKLRLTKVMMRFKSYKNVPISYAIKWLLKKIRMYVSNVRKHNIVILYVEKLIKNCMKKVVVHPKKM